MLIDEMEALFAPIAARDDWGALEEKLADIAEMRAAYGFAPSRQAAPASAESGTGGD